MGKLKEIIDALALALEDLRNFGAERPDLERVKDESTDPVELLAALYEAEHDLRDIGF